MANLAGKGLIATFIKNLLISNLIELQNGFPHVST